MSTRPMVGSLCSALGLLIAAALVQEYSLWSLLGNATVPWFCVTLAIGLLIVTMTAALVGCPAGRIPLSRVLTITIVCSATVGLGMFVDGISYLYVLGDWSASLGEWAAFTVILAVLFWLPRVGQAGTGERADEPDGRAAGGA